MYMDNEAVMVTVTINHGANGRDVSVQLGTTVEQLYNKAKGQYRLADKDKCSPEITGLGKVSWSHALEGKEIIQFPKVSGDKG